MVGRADPLRRSRPHHTRLCPIYGYIKGRCVTSQLPNPALVAGVYTGSTAAFLQIDWSVGWLIGVCTYNPVELGQARVPLRSRPSKIHTLPHPSPHIMFCITPTISQSTISILIPVITIPKIQQPGYIASHIQT